MSFNAALTAGQLTKIRSGSYQADYLITLCANRVVFAGQVNSDLTTPISWAQFNYNNVTVGAYTDVEIDQAILIATTNDKTKATFRGRIRSTPTATVIYCSESSQDFVAGAYFWVLDTYDVFYKLSRPDANGNELVDYDLPYAGCLPEVTGLRSAYVDYVDSTSGKMRVAFSVAGYAVESGATISSYLFSFKASSYTVISGALNTAAVTVDFNAGEQWGKLVVTDSAGRTLTRHFYIFAHDANNLPSTGFENAALTADLQRGWVMNIPAFANVDTVLPDTFAVLWRYNENYGGVAGNLDTTNNIAFIGWLQREEDSASGDAAYSVLTETRFEFTGVGARLQRLVAQLLGFTLNASPTQWGQINNLTPWRGICHFLSRYTTVANLCDLDFSNKDNTYLFPALSTQGGTALQAVMGIAAQIDANVEFAPYGPIRVDRDASYLTTAERAALTTVIAYDYQDIISPQGIVKTLEENRQVGKVDADGLFYNANNGQVTGFTVRSPGHAQGEGAGSATLSNQILAATSDSAAGLNELRQRAGNKYEVENMTEILSVDHPDGYHFIIPSRAQLFTWTLDATLPGANGVNRIVYDTGTNWLCEAFTLTRTGNGTTASKATYRKLTRVGDLGDNTTVIPPNVEEPTVPDLGFPAFPDEYPEAVVPEIGWTEPQVPPTLATPPGTPAGLKGGEVIIKKTTQAFMLTSFIALTTPHSNEITPADLASYLIKQVLFDPFGTANALGAYLLASDGTNSALWNTDSSMDAVPTWTKGADVVDIFTVMRTTLTADKLLIYSPHPSTTTSNTLTVTFDPGSYPYTLVAGTVTTGGNPGNCVDGGLTTTNNCGTSTSLCDITIALPTTATVTAAGLDTKGTGGGTGAWLIELKDGGGGVLASYTANTNLDGTWYTVGSGAVSVANVASIHYASSACGVIGVRKFMDNCTATYNTATGNAAVRLTSDRGISFSTLQIVGTAPTNNIGGFDVQRAGTVSYAAMTGKVRKATTLGGAYADFINTTGANPVCIIIPWYTRNSTTAKNTTTATPDFLVALDAADSDGGTLYWVAGGTAVKTDITPTAGMTFDSPNCITTSYGTHIAVFGKIAGVYHLYTSTNGGTSWTDRGTLTTPGFVRGRRLDNRVVTYGGGNHGQLYYTNGNVIDYSYTWKNGSPRTMPATGIDGFDIGG